MPKESAFFSSTGVRKTIFLASILVAIYWITGQFINVYRFAVLGAIYELLWLPFILLLFGIPLLSLLLWKNDKFNLRSVYFYTMIIGVSTLLYLFLFA